MHGTTNNFFSYTRQAMAGFRYVKHFRLSSIRKVFSLLGKREKIAILLLAIVAFANLYISLRNWYWSMTTPVASAGGTLTEGMLGQPMYINPLLAYQDPDLALTKLVFSSLYKYDAEGKLSPDLADGMPVIAEDQKQYTINLKQGVKWHNNLPFTADDVMFTFETLKNPSYKSPLRTLWSTTSIEKTGDFQVKFTTKDISAPFMHNLTLPILSKWVWETEDPATFTLSGKNLQAIGTGPYQIKEIKKLQSGRVQEITLNPFRGYYGTAPYIERYITQFFDTEQDLLNALHSGEIDAFGFVPLASNLVLNTNPDKFVQVRQSLPQYQVAFLNVRNKILSEAAVRKALELTTDRHEIISEVFHGNASFPAWPFSEPAGRRQTGSVELARQTLEHAGWVVDPNTGIRVKNGIPLELTISTSDFLLNSKAAELLAKQWKELQITVHVDIQPSRQITDNVIKNHNFDILVFPQKLGADPDPFIFWHSSQTNEPGLNLTGYANTAADKLITEARTTTDQEAKKQKLQEFYQLLSTDVPAIPLNQTEYIYAASQKVQNLQLGRLYDPTHRFYYLPAWYISQKRVLK